MSELKSLSALIAEIAKRKKCALKPDFETRLERIEATLSKLTVIAGESELNVASDTPRKK